MNTIKIVDYKLEEVIEIYIQVEKREDLGKCAEQFNVPVFEFENELFIIYENMHLFFNIDGENGFIYNKEEPKLSHIA